MDYGNQNQGNGSLHYQFDQTVPPRNGMTTAASVLGLATIVTCVLLTVYIPFVTGSLAILFALLSKGSDKRMNPSAISGIISAVVGLVMNIVLIISVITLYLTNPVIHERANQLFEQRYGMTIEEMWDEYRNQQPLE